MRKIIIDTDTATDDAAALLIALAQPDTEILAVTTVAGNIPLEKGTRNALMTMETAGREIPVYPGAAAPLYRPLVTADGVHGKDGKYPTSGRELGMETAMGEGKVDFPALIKGLHALGYDRCITIEREIEGEQQAKDIIAAKEYLEKIIAEVTAK